MNSDAYDDFSQDYDLFVDWHSRLAAEMPFIQQYLQQIRKQSQNPPSILDAACGSGMHAIELARQGCSLYAADLSPRMIDKARQNAENAGVKVLFKVCAFGDLAAQFTNEVNFPFDLILCLGNSLPHLVSLESIHCALADMAACLKTGGFLILQNRNFDAVLRGRTRWMAPQSAWKDHQEWIFLRFYDFDADGLITFNIIRLNRRTEEKWSQQVSTTRLFPLRQAELLELLNDTGFVDIRSFGFMGKEEFKRKSSENLVVVARKG